MPSVTYNGQSFAIDGRRLWILGASMHYCRIPAAEWSDRIAAARQAGFNTIETACPWTVHEQRRGRFNFQDGANVRTFIQECGKQGLRVILRAGPYVGSQFDGGGIPGWLAETPGVALREANEIFLEHVSRYFRKLLSEVGDLQATSPTGDGPILLVQSEHAWTCSNDAQGERYLHEITRIIRESGISVPILNANDLWQESRGTIDTWRGYDDLLSHLRQLRAVQPEAPRIVSSFDVSPSDVWGGWSPDESGGPTRGGTARRRPDDRTSPAAVLSRLGEILAAGAQPIVSPFHGGTNFGFLGGRIAGPQAGFVTTSASAGAPLSEAGQRGLAYNVLRRLITFANHFSQVFCDFDPNYQPVVADPSRLETACWRLSIVDQRGAQGRVVFVFARADGDVPNRNESRMGSRGPSPTPATTLVLDNGIRLPIDLGDQLVAWYALDVDLQGSGRLDHSNISPWGMVDRSIVVFQGRAGIPAYISIDDTPLEVTVPEGAKPLVAEHRGLTIVVCNQAQIDATYHDDTAVYVGIGGFEGRGSEQKPVPAPGFEKAWVIRRNARIESLSWGVPSRSSAAGTQLDADRRARHSRKGRASRSAQSKIELRDWQVSSAQAYVAGESPRFASLEGPEPLSACGAPSGYGWYRVRFEASGRKLCHLPQAADRAHLFVDGRAIGVIGAGPGAQPAPLALTFERGKHNLVALVDNFGRFSDGNDLSQCKGLCDHIYEVKVLRAGKPRIHKKDPVNPFVLRGFISGLTAGQVSDAQQLVWTFSHTRKTPLLIDVNGAAPSGTFVLNDTPIAYYAGATGGRLDRIMLDPRTMKAMKRGRNTLRFAPDRGLHSHHPANGVSSHQRDPHAQIARATTIYECRTVLTEPGAGVWSFAKWEPPMDFDFTAIGRRRDPEFKRARGRPCWWRCRFDLMPELGGQPEPPLWLDTRGLSKGQAYVNGQNLGRYFTSTGAGKPVGPQTHLFVPRSWLRAGQTNDLLLFDEHGFDPLAVRLVHSVQGLTAPT